MCRQTPPTVLRVFREAEGGREAGGVFAQARGKSSPIASSPTVQAHEWWYRIEWYSWQGTRIHRSGSEKKASVEGVAGQ